MGSSASATPTTAATTLMRWARASPRWTSEGSGRRPFQRGPDTPARPSRTTPCAAGAATNSAASAPIRSRRAGRSPARWGPRSRQSRSDPPCSSAGSEPRPQDVRVRVLRSTLRGTYGRHQRRVLHTTRIRRTTRGRVRHEAPSSSAGSEQLPQDVLGALFRNRARGGWLYWAGEWLCNATLQRGEGPPWGFLAQKTPPLRIGLL
ncbi:hypothetical protein T484DRAFT_3467003 [Baffinella frigidus]|nr:hypothetical protein T484DRAFT_3467003 [Cryptophyta sp. CCMP2293]